MSKIFVIPDVHLKPWIFEKASQLASAGDYDAVVMLGDLVDDWYEEKNIRLYNETFDAAISFVESHPDTFWCFGNHDISYLWDELESGYSHYAKSTVINRIKELMNTLPPENCAFIHKIDNVVFSHAGLTEKFVNIHFSEDTPDLDTMIARINCMGNSELWQAESPLWARPQYGAMRIYEPSVLQVVGHTPVKTALLEGSLLTLDNFSTYRNRKPIGNERFVWIDTINRTWDYCTQ